MKPRIITIFLITMLLSIPVFAQNKSVLDRILNKKEIRIGTSAMQPPYTMRAKDGSLMGYEIEIAELLAQAMNVEIVWVELPFKELISSLQKRKIDAVLSGMTMSVERNLKVAFAGPYLITGRSILALDKRLDELDELDEFNRPVLKAAAIEGSISQRFAENRANKVKLVKVPDYETGVKLVLDKKVDLMFADYAVCLLSLLRNPNAGLATLDLPLTIEPVGIALPPNEFLLHNLINNYLSALQAAGILDDLESRWFSNGDWLDRMPK